MEISKHFSWEVFHTTYIQEKVKTSSLVYLSDKYSKLTFFSDKNQLLREACITSSTQKYF